MGKNYRWGGNRQSDDAIYLKNDLDHSSGNI
ncbi:hypothetical protein OKW21_003127 [Catalinimonas alkaloidigena]|nr:hypothetical protein [Catalinimonas alkaloidigena]